MKIIDTEILVIGGGATGTGILRDLAMRGFRAVLVEKRDLTHGTTGRFHGLLHSGARYAVKDPAAARECIEENRILRRIMPHCIEDTGGFFVQTPWDDPAYAKRFLRGCHEAGIPVEELSAPQMLAREPLLNPNVTRCFHVPDAAADGFAAAHANVNAARQYGAQALPYHEVTRLLTDTGRVQGALCQDLVHDEPVAIHADLVINAAGAWVGKIGATAGVEIAIRPGKGTMIAVNHRIVNTVINRLKMPSDGDILVPAHTVAVMGTTDLQVPDPDQFAIEPWEIELMLAEGEKIIPGFRQMRFLRAWAGVRPLYQETKTGPSRDITRSFVLLDHEQRDGLAGLLTITSGKWTTYRKMAAVTVDKACEKLGTRRECRTHLERLPQPDSDRTPAPRRHHTLGERLAHVEHAQAYGDLICECELATRSDIEQAIANGQAHTLDDIRRDMRLGMGPCQGGFCTLRAAGLWHCLKEPSPEAQATNAALRDFLQERWKGVLPVLWGQQLRQERLNELIYLNVLNLDHLPGPTASPLRPENYLPPGHNPQPGEGQPTPASQPPPAAIRRLPPVDALVIGGGLAGLTAAWRLVCRGHKVRLVTKGWGATHWGAGCIDVLGYYPIESHQAIESPLLAMARLALEQPAHPYARLSMKQIGEALRAFQELCAGAGYPLHGSLERNWLLPTAAGAFRPTCLAPETMIAGDLTDKAPMLIVGFSGYHDFYPQLVAANLQEQGIPARAVLLDSAALAGLQRRRIDALTLARLFEQAPFRSAVAQALLSHLDQAERLGFPAVLGLRDPLRAMRGLESLLGRRIFEIPGLPPSVPGLRLHQILVEAIQKSGGQVIEGAEAIGSQPSQNGRQIEAVWTEAAARPLAHVARHYILASGGFLGGGLMTSATGEVGERVFGLDIQSPQNRLEWVQRQFLHPSGHPIFRAGAQTDAQFRTVYENVYALGGALAGDFVRERSLEGVALASGFYLGEALA
jgi:glycerol-3-phosphate dehydrogenase